MLHVFHLRGARVKRLLLVDDDDSILESLEDLLADQYAVQLARNGAEALDLIAGQPFDVMLLDLMMPVMSGDSLLRELKSRGIEIATVLGSASGRAAQVAKALGARDWIPKPYDINDLEAKLARAAGGGPGSGNTSGGGSHHRSGDGGSGTPQSEASGWQGRPGVQTSV